MADALLRDIQLSDTPGVKWAILQRWVALLANNIGSGGTGLPSQVGNAGKFLTTDGTTASWASISATGTRIAETITQAAHGFSAENVVYNNNGTWALAKADALGTSFPRGVIESVTTNTFVVVYSGPITVAGKTAGTAYYLSAATAGLLTSTAPSGSTTFVVPVLMTGTATQGYVNVGQPASNALINFATAGTGIVPTANGGTGIAYFTAAGPTAARVYTFPDSAATILYSGGALGTPSSGTLSGCTVDGTNLVGFLGVPQNSKSANYTTVLADAGKEIFHPVGDNNARTFTIDSNANVAHVIGTVIIFTNLAAANLTIAITSDTLTWLGTGGTGSRTLAQYGSAAARKVTSTGWIISGVNLT